MVRWPKAGGPLIIFLLEEEWLLLRLGYEPLLMFRWTAARSACEPMKNRRTSGTLGSAASFNSSSRIALGRPLEVIFKVEISRTTFIEPPLHDPFFNTVQPQHKVDWAGLKLK
ncbi:unnamed protein product [Heligmosomoides polygyrus]|uniref:Uncharacterized protein n=1 Tax=Heligmosomoides polygyrus TaxID=6339 RepID=A0A183FY60_HELPZ|nr:unnamed protein product [Heligmosomoides polygyrus]